MRPVGRPSYVSEADKDHLQGQGDSGALQGRMFSNKTSKISLYARVKAEARGRKENNASIDKPFDATANKHDRDLLPVPVKTPGHQNLRQLIVSIK